METLLRIPRITRGPLLTRLRRTQGSQTSWPPTRSRRPPSGPAFDEQAISQNYRVAILRSWSFPPASSSRASRRRWPGHRPARCGFTKSSMTDTGWWCAEMHRVRCFTRNGYDWADRFTGIVEAALRIKASSFLIDGEAVITSDDGMSDFRAMRKADRARLTRPLTAGVNLFREH